MPVYKNFNALADMQYRNRTVLVDPETVILRGGLEYKFPNKIKTAAGYAYALNFFNDSNVLRSHEHRIWEQFLYTKQIGRLFFEDRIRIEQRFFSSNSYQNRFRNKLQLYIPINKPTFEPGTFFATFYDEIFLISKSSFFDRNRIYGAVGYQVHTNLSIQLGYINQLTKNSSKDYLYLQISNKF